MKKIVINILKVILKCCAVLVCVIVFAWLLEEAFPAGTYHANGVPTYFLEPEDCVIVKVYTSDGVIFDVFHYGYITNADYQAYLNGTLNGVLVIQHPYEENRNVVVPVNAIQSMTVGIYKSRSDDQPRSIYDSFRLLPSVADKDDLTVFYPDIGKEGLGARAVYDLSVFNNKVKHIFVLPK